MGEERGEELKLQFSMTNRKEKDEMRVGPVTLNLKEKKWKGARENETSSLSLIFII